LSELESSNEHLAQTIVQQRSEIDGLIKSLERIVNDLERAAEKAQGEEAAGLAAESRAINEELRAADTVMGDG